MEAITEGSAMLSLPDLNYDVLWAILSYLSMADVERVSQACKRFRLLVEGFVNRGSYLIDLGNYGLCQGSSLSRDLTYPDAWRELRSREHRWRLTAPASSEDIDYNTGVSIVLYSQTVIVAVSSIVFCAISPETTLHMASLTQADQIKACYLDATQDLLLAVQIATKYDGDIEPGDDYFSLLSPCDFQKHPKAAVSSMLLGHRYCNYYAGGPCNHRPCGTLLSRPKIMGPWCCAIFSAHRGLVLRTWDWQNNPSPVDMVCTRPSGHPDFIDFRFINDAFVVILSRGNIANGREITVALWLDIFRIARSGCSAQSQPEYCTSLLLPAFRRGVFISRAVKGRLGPDIRTPGAPNARSEVASDIAYELPESDTGLLVITLSLEVTAAARGTTANFVIRLDLLLALVDHTRLEQYTPWVDWGPDMARIFLSPEWTGEVVPPFGDPLAFRIPFATRPKSGDIGSLPNSHRIGILDFNPFTVAWAKDQLQRGLSLPDGASLNTGGTLVDDVIFKDPCVGNPPYYRTYVPGTHNAVQYALTNEHFFIALSHRSQHDGRHLVYKFA